MLRNYAITALRNLVRNRLYAAINIIGLAFGLAAALLIALFVRDELSYDTWIPGYENVYRLSTKLTVESDAGRVDDQTAIPTEAAAWLKLEVPTAEAVARLVPDSVSVRHGDIESDEVISWVDPDFFSIVKPPVLAGDLGAVLRTPGNAAISRRIAHKYFGIDAPLGATLEINRRQPLRIVAVIEDLPPNTTLTADSVTSTQASFSPTAQDDALPPSQFRGFHWVYAYMRLPPHADISQIEHNLHEALRRRYPPEVAGMKFHLDIRLTPISEVHLTPLFGSGDIKTVQAISVVGILIAAVALINFINLMTARSARRAVEVGVRKVTGAQRRNLIVQFIGESLLYVALGAVLAMGLAQLLLPYLNAFLQRAIRFDTAHSPAFLAGLAVAVVLAGVTAGAYPALVLSSFPPVFSLKRNQEGRGPIRLRQVLVVCQFAILIGLSLGAVIVSRQTRFAMNENLRLNTDQVLLIKTAQCPETLKDAVLALPGVRAAACSSNTMIGEVNGTVALSPTGTKVVMSRAAVDYGLLELYGLRPIAGRFFSRELATDAADAYGRSGPQMPVVINEKLMHDLGYATPNQALGQSMSWVNEAGSDGLGPRPSTIIGVAADFATHDVTTPIDPMAFFVDHRQGQLLHVKMAGDRIPETLAAIDNIWHQIGNTRPIRRSFFDQHVEAMYREIESQGALLTVFTATAIFIACLGLFGLSAFTAERRTKEIGIRKAMGASKVEIVRLLLWQFTKPVLWANVIAWPAAYFIMQRWLKGFAYHIDLAPWMFLAASALAIAIAVLTVIGHALLVARAKPVAALRYE